ncbi:hypothetical protein H9L13_00075 [Sphingomonas lutea]|uniref:Uncharacterized protein n=1 Tax=Sphingomonas lutea TaxID=1045317 RepID=A0A7G9SHT9_9SPHN|nr:hypothetical protein [Sphingomonas lutea]QNN67414.1 hypothetical protein H9L13_00075 [Sphingomonas lutea]
MSKSSKKPTVELKPSRIRREPRGVEVPTGPAAKAWFDPGEWESWIVIVGVIAFAIGLTALSIGIGEVTSH